MNANSTEDRSVVVLVLGIAGILGCCIASPFAWWIGALQLSAMQKGELTDENRNRTLIGMMLGVFGTLMLILGILFYVIFAVFFAGGAGLTPKVT